MWNQVFDLHSQIHFLVFFLSVWENDFLSKGKALEGHTECGVGGQWADEVIGHQVS